MILSKLHALSEAKAGDASATHRFTIRVRSDYLSQLDELAEELGLPRAVIAREALENGIRILFAEWESAQEEAKEAKKATKAQIKLKLAGAA